MSKIQVDFDYRTLCLMLGKVTMLLLTFVGSLTISLFRFFAIPVEVCSSKVSSTFLNCAPVVYLKINTVIG
jgi:hypothetical protein